MLWYRRISSVAPTLVALGVTLVPRIASGQAPRPSVWVTGDFAAVSGFGRNVSPTFAQSRIQSSRVSAGIVAPFMFSQGRTMLIVGWTYGMRRFQPSRLPAGSDPMPRELHEGGMDVTVRQALSERWALMVQGSGSMASDFVGSVDAVDALRYHGTVLAVRTFSPQLTAGLGATYGNGLGFDFPIPVVLLEWKDGRGWRVSGTLPADLGAWYRMGPVEAGIETVVEGAHYTTNTLFRAAEPRLHYFVAKVGPSLRLHAGRSLSLTAHAGAAYQRVRLQDGTTELPNSNYDLKPTFFAATRLEISL